MGGMGRVYLVGAGPGDPGLLTLRGREVLGQADVVVYDALIAPRILDFVPARAERIYVGKRASAHAVPQEEIHRLLVQRARAGATVVRLKGGDPFIFGRGGEEALALAEAEIPFEIVPGVTAAVAAAACAGIPLTHRDLASAVAFVTGHEANAKASALDWDALARWPGTLVFYMGVANLREIAENLIARGLAPDTPAAAIHWGATPQQKVFTGTLKTLPALTFSLLKPPALILVGKVVALREPLAWFEKRPLFGRRIVVTRPREDAAEFLSRLEALGAETILAPAIRIEPPEDPSPLREAVCGASDFDWIVFTSARGVDAWFGVMDEAGLDARALAGRCIATIGPATAARLAARGIQADIQPEHFTSAALAETLVAAGDIAGAKILLPRADIAPKDLAEALADRGATVREVVAYRTVPDPGAMAAVVERLAHKTIDWITFTSASTVRNFCMAAGVDRMRASGAHLASIGPVTSAALRVAALEPTVEAGLHTVEGLVDAIVAREKTMPSGPPGT